MNNDIFKTQNLTWNELVLLKIVLMYYETCLLCAFIKHVIKQNYNVMQHESNNEMKATDG